MSSSPSIVEPRRPLAPRLVVALLAAFALVLGPLAFVPASAAPGDDAAISVSIGLSGNEELLNIPVTLETLGGSDEFPRWEYAETGYTDEAGEYVFGNMSPGTYRVKSGGPSTGETGVTPYAIRESDVIDLDGTDVTVPLDLVLGGSISGTTTLDNGDALGGVRVIASRLEDDLYDLEREWNSDEDGLYTVSGLRDGTYQLDFSKDDFLSEYYDDIPFDRENNTGATTVTIVNGNAVTGKDADLTPAAIVSGVVTAGGDPLAGIAVSAYHKVVSGGVTSWESSQSYAFTAEDGSYRINTLPAGSYRIGFDDQDGMHASEYFDDQPSVYSEDVTTFAVEPGDTMTANAELALGGSISGTITGPDDEPVPACVDAYGTVDGTFDEVKANPENIIAEQDGTYVLKGLAAGDYKLKFFDCNGDLASEYWENQKTFADADLVTVAAEATTENINAQLAAKPTSALIEGVVTDTTSNGAKLSGVEVSVQQKFTDGDDVQWFGAGSDTTDADGAYDVQVEDEGTYRVKFQDRSGLHFTAFYGGSTTEEEALPVTVELGDVKTADAALAPASVITGTLSGAVEEACPTAYAVTDEAQANPYWEDLDPAPGTYRIGYLPAGEYKLRLDCGPQFGGAAFTRVAGVAAAAAVTQNWYLNKTSFAAATTIERSVGEATPLQPVTIVSTVPPVVNPPVAGPPAPPAVVKVKPSIKVSAKAGKKSATLKITVKASGVTPTGKVTIKLGGKKLKTVTLKRGKATVKLKKLKKGKRVFTIVYAGDSRVLARTVKTKRLSIK
nr:hypothetical protein [Aeromicrobium sp.]